MSEKLVRKVALAALAGKKVQAPEATNKEISLAIMEAAERGIVEASDLTNMDSHHPEWLLIGPTGLTERYVRESRISKKVWVGALAVIGVLIGFAKWLIPILVSLLKGGK
jgi:hypothetical protein